MAGVDGSQSFVRASDRSISADFISVLVDPFAFIYLPVPQPTCEGR